MISVHFSKAFAQTVIDAFKTGKPIAPPSGNWTGNEMLTLAGMLYAGVVSQGPHNYQVAGITAEMKKQMPRERREAIDETFTQDIHDAIEFLSGLMFQVIDGKYDQHLGPEISAAVYRDGDRKCVLPAKGFKKAKNLMGE
jgi:hypothetical protein